ncbi:MAG TPA: signal recognition particle protein [Bdellovibrionales bacterium]|nr:signal recognition particle protein [Bdellovibrionales bacterium]
MFETLSDKLTNTLRKVRGQARITETNVEEAIKEIRLSLLEADVNFRVVKNFLDQVKAKSIGQDVMQGIDAGQQFVKIVHDELVDMLGKTAEQIDVRGNPAVIMLVGLQGVGKTTTAAKLALYIRQKLQKKPGLVPADIYRPAAIEQLTVLANQNNIPVFPSKAGEKAEDIVKRAQVWAKEEMVEVVVIDTAGRLQIDEPLMNELRNLKSIWPPGEVLLVSDAMLGQQSVQVAEGFHQQLGLSGLILTKVDGDARGGAALSIRSATGVPIKFLGVGEKVANLEVFHPDRLAGRILGMGDVLSLVEKASEVIDEKTARESARKIAKAAFTLEDFLSQLQMMKKMGGLESLMKMIPGMGNLTKQLKDMSPPDKEVKKIEAIIRSMTPGERNNPKILNGSRRLRIASGSGTEVKDVNRLVDQFTQAQKMMSQMMKMGMGGKGGKRPF